LDECGNLALPVLDYEFEFPRDLVEAYTAIRPPFSETLSPRLPAGLNLGAQIYFQKSTLPREFARVRTILMYPQYWVFRLSGVLANEVTSLGCHTDLWLPEKKSYSKLVDRLGIRSLMAPISSAFDELGPLKKSIAENLGLTRSIPVFCGIHDSNASLLPHLMSMAPPFSVVSTGTWTVNFAIGGDVQHLDPRRDSLANVDAYGNAVASSRFMGGREFQHLEKELGQFDQAAAFETLPNVIKKQVMLLPSVIAGCGPFPEKDGRWLNCEPSLKAERWCAACLYLALMTESCLDLIGAKGPILVEGPLASNWIYLTALASFTGREAASLSNSSTGTSFGAALLASAQPAIADRTIFRPDEIEGLQKYRAAWKHAAE